MARTPTPRLKDAVQRALDRWTEAEAESERRILGYCATRDLDRLRCVGYALARPGRWRREAADEFLERYESDRRYGPRTAILYARAYLLEDDPRAFVREMGRVASLPGTRPWVAIMEELYWMWSRAPRDMFRLVAPWLTHRDPWRRWAALHGLEVPARRDPRAALKVLRLLRGERHPRVRRMLGHVWGQSLYPQHPEESFEELARWLEDGAAAAAPVARQAERQVATYFERGMGTERQRRSVLRVSREYAEHWDAGVRRHARRVGKLVES